MKSVEIDSEGDIIVDGVGTVAREKFSALRATERVLAAADMNSLAAAIRNPDRYQFDLPDVIQIVLGGEDHDPFLFPADEVYISVDEQRISAAFDLMILPGTRLPDDDYRRLLQPSLAALGCRVAELEFALWDGSLEKEADWIDWTDPDEISELLTEARQLCVHVVGGSVANIIRGARQARALLTAVADRPLNAQAAAQLVRAGLLETVVGLRESEWLEVKSDGYHLGAGSSADKARQKLELAQDVARFANGDTEAVLIVGYRTINAPDVGEVIDKVTPVKVIETNAEQHQKVIDAHVYPTVESLRVDQVLLGEGRAILVIEIPRQPDYLKPFLVHGAVVGGRADGSFFSIVRRRDSHSVVTNPSQVHAQIAAGRALLRGAQVAAVDESEPT